MKTTKFENYNIKVERYVPNVSQKGIIHGVSGDFSDDSLKEGLSASDVKITDAKRLGKSNSVMVTFKGSVLPSHVFYGYLRFTVKLYIPSPLRCYKCQHFGHVADKCRSNFRCAKCGDKHDTRTCTVNDVVKCCNCGGTHKASSPECKQFEQAKEINRVKTVQNISYADAIKKVKGKAQSPKVIPAPGPPQSNTGKMVSKPKVVAQMSQVPQKSQVSAPDYSEYEAPQVHRPPFNWNEFAAFMVKALSMFSTPSYQKKDDLQKIIDLGQLMKDVFQVEINRNETCHFLFADDKVSSVGSVLSPEAKHKS